MSFNILMVPVAIALRVVMGEEGFDKWVRSNERRMQTQIRTDQELERIVTTAGYDLIKYGSFKKTHFGDTFFCGKKRMDAGQQFFQCMMMTVKSEGL